MWSSGLIRWQHFDPFKKLETVASLDHEIKLVHQPAGEAHLLLVRELFGVALVPEGLHEFGLYFQFPIDVVDHAHCQAVRREALPLGKLHSRQLRM